MDQSTFLETIKALAYRFYNIDDLLIDLTTKKITLFLKKGQTDEKNMKKVIEDVCKEFDSDYKVQVK